MEILSYYQYFPAFTAILFLLIIILKFTLNRKSALKKYPLLYFLPVILLTLLSIFSYLLSKAVLAQYFFRQSIRAKTVNEVYEYQRKAIVTNPNIDQYRVRFSQTNLLIANSLLDKSKEPSAEDKQTAAKAVQAAIEEAKAAVKLDDKKASNWANLANIYKNLLNMAQNADTWTISAYQRAIILDSQNAEYHLELGGVYYLLKKYDDAINAFEEAIRLKPDWPNAYYNLAWTYYQKGEVEKAISNMETTISLLSNQNNTAELTKAQKDLEEFKKKL